MPGMRAGWVVAVAIVRAGWVRVAGDPVLVEVLAWIGSRGHHRTRPVEAVGRAVDDDRDAGKPARLNECQRLRKPNAMLGVIGDDRVGHAVKGPGCVWCLVRPGSTPLVHVTPPSFDVEKAVPEAPPSKYRPTCATETIVLPNANVSGSTAVACWLCGFLDRSAITSVIGIAACADGAATSSADAAAAEV